MITIYEPTKATNKNYGGLLAKDKMARWNTKTKRVNTRI